MSKQSPRRIRQQQRARERMVNDLQERIRAQERTRPKPLPAAIHEAIRRRS